jgi:hypothetical protein
VIALTDNLIAREKCHATLTEVEMNFALEGGDQSPHSMSDPDFAIPRKNAFLGILFQPSAFFSSPRD